MTPINRVILGRRVQLLLHVRVCSKDYSPRDWWVAVMHRRSRGWWPRTNENMPFPVFHFWNLGPFDLRVWTERATRYE